MSMVTIKKEIELIVEGVSCKCGESLSFDVDVDNWGDIDIEVAGHNCTESELLDAANTEIDDLKNLIAEMEEK